MANQKHVDHVNWIHNSVGSQTDWVEFIMPGEAEDAPNRKIRMNVSFLLSNYACTFGNCPGILVHSAKTDVSCCQIGVGFGRGTDRGESMADFSNIKKHAEMLTAEDADNYDIIASGEWYDKETTKMVIGRGTSKKKRNKTTTMVTPVQTKVVDGGCVFANRHGGKANNPGCSLHQLAGRLGKHHAETKPEICWQIPLAVDFDYEEEIEANVIIIDATPAARWGSEAIDDPEHVGYWCIDTPDAYGGSGPVYLSLAYELKKIVGEDVYGEVAKRLGEIKTPRYPMPGQVANGGRPMLPLLVKKRADLWAEEGMQENLDASREYFEKTNLI